MRWAPADCRPGDIIRVKVGPVWHYGIFVSENEVIQFGEPPVAGPLSGRDQKIIATDIDFFSAGGIVERGELDRSEEKRRFPREKTVALARSRLGEGGYDIIRNNCEHFAYECLFGEGRSLQEEELRKKWLARPFLDVYVAPIPEEPDRSPVYPPERQAEIDKCRNEKVRAEKIAVWRLLEKGVSRSLGLNIEELRFKKRRDGKWVSDRAEFSLSHSHGAAAVAVSSAPCGVDIENAAEFRRRWTSPEKLRSLAKRISTARELELVDGPDSFLSLWTKKEAVFKLNGGKSFFPHKTDTFKTVSETRLISIPEEYSLSVCGDCLSRLRLYLVTEKGAVPMSADEMK